MNRQEVSKRLSILSFVLTYPLAFFLGMSTMHNLGYTFDIVNPFDGYLFWKVYYDFPMWEIVRHAINLLIVSMVVVVFAIIYVTEFAKEVAE